MAALAALAALALLACGPLDPGAGDGNDDTEGSVGVHQRALTLNKAAALRWAGYLDSNIDFSSFINKDHTITVWYMPQYPRGYEGPILTNDSKTYFFGQGDYRASSNRQKRLVLKVNGTTDTFLVPNLQPGQWYHLAVVRTQTAFLVYLDGNQLCAEGQLFCHLDYFGPDFSGRVRIGRDDPSEAGVRRQLYGLVDDLAVFDRALTKAEIQALRGKPELSRTEPGLRYLWNFDESAREKRNWSLHDSAFLTYVSHTRDSKLDQLFLPLPDENRFTTNQLPFKRGQAWVVSQEYADTNSHNGTAAFAYDFELAGQQTAGKPTNAYCQADPSCGEPLYASAAGSIIEFKDSGGFGSDGYNSPKCGSTSNDDYDGDNFARVRQASYQVISYMHLYTGSIAEALPGMFWPPFGIGAGTWFGRVGTRNGCHLHMSFNNYDPAHGGLPYPAAFHDYEACDGNCQLASSWYKVSRGVPRKGQQVRRPKLLIIQPPKL